jgi:signal transduction histidine kinase
MPNMLNTKVKQLPMLDYVSAGIAFYITMLPVQEWILEFRLGYLGRYWSLISVVGLLIGSLLCALIFVPLIINMILNPFKYPDNAVMNAIAAVIFGAILWLGQWLILRQTEMTPRVFALINTVVGISVFSVLVWFNQKSLQWSGGPIEGWRTGLIFLAGGTVTRAATGKALDFYCGRVEQRLIKLERERVEQETQERERLLKERIEKEKLAQERLEAEMAERKRIQREAAQEEERLWYEQHGKDYADYEYEEEEEEE